MTAFLSYIVFLFVWIDCDMRELVVISLVTFICYFLPTLSYAKKIYNEEHTVIIEDLIGSKPQIFDLTKIWVSKNFKSANDVIQHLDKDQGKFILKGITSPLCDKSVGRLECSGYSSAKVSFTLMIDIQDHRVRLKFMEPGYALYNNSPLDDPITYRLVINRFNEVVDNYKRELASEPDAW